MISKNVAIEIKLEPNLPMIYADPGHLEQALLNLTLNARDAMSGGGTLLIRSSAGCPKRPAGPVGGTSAAELTEAGAVAIYEDAAALLRELDSSPLAAICRPLSAR